MAKYTRYTFSIRVNDDQAAALGEYLYLLNRLKLAPGFIEAFTIPSEARWATVQGETYEQPEPHFLLRIYYAVKS